MPIFLVLAFGVIQYGLYFWSMQAGTAAVGDAARRMSVGDCQTEAQVETYLASKLGAARTSGAVDVHPRVHEGGRHHQPAPHRVRSAGAQR